MKLREKSTGRVVQIGDKHQDQAGKTIEVVGFLTPGHANSSGRVYMSNGREYFPHVFGLIWVKNEEDERKERRRIMHKKAMPPQTPITRAALASVIFQLAVTQIERKLGQAKEITQDTSMSTEQKIDELIIVMDEIERAERMNRFWEKTLGVKTEKESKE